MELTPSQAAALTDLRSIDTLNGDSQKLLNAIVLLAQHFFLPLQVECGITFHNNRQLVSVAQTLPIIQTLEEAQNPREGGPVFNSLLRGTTTVVDEALNDDRWAAYLTMVATHGYHSILSMCLLTTGPMRATINVYAVPPSGFTPNLRTAGEHFAAQSAQRLRALFVGPSK